MYLVTLLRLWGKTRHLVGRLPCEPRAQHTGINRHQHTPMLCTHAHPHTHKCWRNSPSRTFAHTHTHTHTQMPSCQSLTGHTDCGPTAKTQTHTLTRTDTYTHTRSCAHTNTHTHTAINPPPALLKFSFLARCWDGLVCPSQSRLLARGLSRTNLPHSVSHPPPPSPRAPQSRPRVSPQHGSHPSCRQRTRCLEVCVGWVRGGVGGAAAPPHASATPFPCVHPTLGAAPL